MWCRARYGENGCSCWRPIPAGLRSRIGLSSKYTLEEKIADRWTLPWPWLADWTAEWCRRQLGAAGQPPLEGYEGVWHIRSGERTETADRGESGWVLQRGNTVFRMKDGALPDEMWLDEVLSRLEGET